MASEIIHDFVLPAVLSVLSIIVGYVVWLLQQQRTEHREAIKEQKAAAEIEKAELDAIKKGLMLKLRRDILEDHRKYVNNHEEMSADDYDNICDMYEAYKVLGGNGTAAKAMKEINNVHLS